LARAIRPTRLPGLDVLRAIAIAWVMVCHANTFGLLASDYFGWMGVDLFFVLSGFLIGGQLFRPLAEGEAPAYANFFARRLLRTLPAYLVVVALYVAFPILWDRRSLQPAWQFLTFTQNLFIDPAKANSLSQAWSLCVEEQFYLLLPAAVVLFGSRARPKTLVATILAVLAFGMVLRGYLWLAHVAEEPLGLLSSPNPRAYMRCIYYPTWTRLDGLLAGVTVALVKTFRPEAWAFVRTRPNALLAAGGLGVGLSMLVFRTQVTTFWPTVFGFPLLAASMAALVAAASEPGSLLGRWPLPGAGPLAAASYSLYLTHKMAYRAAIRLTHHGSPELQALTPVLAVAAALAIGAALYLLVERPCLKLRDRLRSPTSSAGPVVVQPAE
jgi:peptidoglycan/LPS O-acetylase OafA/YrhL